MIMRPKILYRPPRPPNPAVPIVPYDRESTSRAMIQDEDSVDGIFEWITVGLLVGAAVLIAITISGATPGLQIYDGPDGSAVWISSRASDGTVAYFFVLLAAALISVCFGANMALCEKIGTCHAKSIDTRMQPEPGCCSNPRNPRAGQQCCCCLSCQHFAFTVTVFLVMSMGIVTFLIAFVLCQQAKRPPQAGAYMIGAAGIVVRPVTRSKVTAQMIIAASIEILVYLHNSSPMGGQMGGMQGGMMAGGMDQGMMGGGDPMMGGQGMGMM